MLDCVGEGRNGRGREGWILNSNLGARFCFKSGKVKAMDRKFDDENNIEKICSTN